MESLKADKMSFGERIRMAREAKGLTQKELADAVGMSQPALYNTESGRNKSSTKIVDFASVLGVSPDWILYGKEMSNAEINSSQILTWDDNSRVPDDIVAIPYLNGCSLSAGTGAVNAYIPYEGAKLWFAKSFLKRRCSDISKVFSIDVKGDSMSPRFDEGGIVVIDSLNNKFEDGKVFAIHYDDQDFIKVLRWMPDGKILVVSENEIYKPFEVKAEELQIIGRVIAYQKEEF